ERAQDRDVRCAPGDGREDGELRVGLVLVGGGLLDGNARVTELVELVGAKRVAVAHPHVDPQRERLGEAGAAVGGDDDRHATAPAAPGLVESASRDWLAIGEDE